MIELAFSSSKILLILFATNCLQLPYSFNEKSATVLSAHTIADLILILFFIADLTFSQKLEIIRAGVCSEQLGFSWI